MENASKALIMTASVLIGIMIISFMMYIFNKFKIIAKETESRYSRQEKDALNTKFIGYETGGTHTLDDELTVTYARNISSSGVEKSASSDNISYRKLFVDSAPAVPAVNETNGTKIKKYEKYKKQLISASQNLNTIANVVTCINDAIDWNYRNNYGYKAQSLEVQNSIEVIVDLGNNSYFKQRYLSVEPNKSVELKYIYGQANKNISNNKKQNVEKFDSSNKISVSELLEKFRETKVIDFEGKTYTIYKYYFFGEISKNSETELIDTIRFTLVEDKNF